MQDAVMRIIETGHPGVTAIAFSPDGTLATVGKDSLIRLWELGAPDDPVRLAGPARCGPALAFSPDGTTLAVAAVGESVWLWDVAVVRQKAPVGPRTPGWGPACAFVWLNRGRFLATGSGDVAHPDKGGDLCVWDFDRPAKPILRVPEPHGVWAVAASPAGKTVFWGGGGRRVSVQDLTSPDRFAFPPQTKEVRALALSPDGATLASADDWTVRLYDTARRQQRTTLTGHKGRVTTLAFSPDGRTLASAGWDQRVRFWDPDAGRERAAFDWGVGRIAAVAFAPDGLLAAAAGEGGKVVVWDVDEA
jgi:WD40 repeat protein